MFTKIKEFIKEHKEELIGLGIIVLVGIIRISKLKSTISQQKGELAACEKVNRELLKENMHQAYIIGKQQERINKI